jgi:hypothetical protein
MNNNELNIIISIVLFFISIYLSSYLLNEYKKYDLKSSYYYGLGFMFSAGIYLLNSVLIALFLL